MSLVFESLLKRLNELNYDKIKDEYWNLSVERGAKVLKSMQEPDKDIFNFSEKRNLITILADHIDKYLKNKQIHVNNQLYEVINSFIDSQEAGIPQYRKDLSNLINSSSLNFDYLLIKDIFINSMELRNPTLTISVNDLITIYNSLVDKGEIIFIQDYQNEDPIYELIEALGNERIEINQNEKQFISEEMLEYRLNLEIKIRVLAEKSEITKCCDCNAPVYQDLIPLKRFKEGIEDKVWRCQTQDCISNEPNTMICYKCGRYRDEITMPRDLVFERYKQVVTDKNVYVFQQILFYLPPIDIHQNLDDMIQYEMGVEDKKKSSDYDKLKIIEQFKK